MHTGHTGTVRAVCALELDGRPVVASAGDDGTVRVWDPADATIAVHTGHIRWVTAVCALELDGHPVVASAGHDGTVRVWDPADATIAVHARATGLAALRAELVVALDVGVILLAIRPKQWGPARPTRNANP